MMSERNKGASISEVVGRYLGPVMLAIMRVFAVVLLVLVGTVFATGPAGLLTLLCKDGGLTGLLVSKNFWLTVILVYYFIATFIPIDKIIGQFYPLFGLCLIIMAVGVAGGILTGSQYHIPELWDNFQNMDPKGKPIWSLMFVTVACGAISGFHATQSPLMARCMKSERQGHFVFYGAMVCEGIIALIWASAACAIYTVADGHMVGLAEKLGSVKPAGVVYEVCKSTMGGIGTVLAMLGVVACPITSGDTAFRSARLTVADWFKIPQAQILKRLSIAVPLLLIGAGLSQIDDFLPDEFDRTDIDASGRVFNDQQLVFNIVWRYFSWTNQTLAMIVLWTASMYLFLEKKNYWITAVPATFMSAVSATYFCMAPECLGKVVGMPLTVSYGIGIAVAVLFLAMFLMATKKRAEV